jgi:heat shock protein HslJ
MISALLPCLSCLVAVATVASTGVALPRPDRAPVISPDIVTLEPESPSESLEPEVDPSPALVDTAWLLDRYQTADGQWLTVPPHLLVSLKFDQDYLGGIDGCNSYGGPYQLEGDRLDLGDLHTTLMYCQDVPDFGLFGGVPSDNSRVAWSETHLYLANAEGVRVAEFVPFGFRNRWQLDTYRNIRGEQVDVRLLGQSLFLDLDPDGRMAGDFLCHRVAGSYERSPGGLDWRLDEIAQTGCDSLLLRWQDIQIMALLTEEAIAYRQVNDELRLMDASGNEIMTLSLLRPWPLQGRWRLLSLAQDANAPLEGTTISLELTGASAVGEQISGEVSGEAGCNRYMSSFTLEGDRLTLAPAASTRMFCSAPGVMAQEQTYLQQLERVARYRIEGDRLVVMDEQGDAIAQFVMD